MRPATSSDDADVRRVTRAAFGDEGDVITAILRDLTAGELLRSSLVAGTDGEVVGHVALSHVWVDARDRLVDALVLSPLSVLPEHQGRGTGRSLVSAALAAADGLGVPLVFLEGDPRYYGRLGFETARDRGFSPPSRRTPVGAFQVAVLSSWERSMVGAVVYPDVWWRHDAAGLRDPALAELEEILGSWDD